MNIRNYIRKITGINDLSEEVEKNRRKIKELDWANIYNNTIVGSSWLQDQNFSPGRWAVGYPFLYLLFRILDDINPKNILEFGLGESSKMLFRYAKHFPNSMITTLEHDELWMKFFLKNKKLHPNTEIVQVENIYTTHKGFKTLSINNLKEKVGDVLYELILVDAPFGSERYSRSQILSLLPRNIDRNHFCIIMDDYDRLGEKDTCHDIENILKTNSIEYYSGIYRGEKDLIVYCSPDIKFLTTL